ncbi:hypothetical protein [Bdellovibrio sp. HCB337]|uniref:hypothetical protein n=1 Tax=Bdellovibrio sp. HCB337 TaxID=3394358 RepID=UPI0039A5EB39
MKNMFLTLAAFVTLSSQAYAGTFTCKEIETDRSEKVEVVVTELADITDQVSFGKAFDQVLKVRLQIFSVVGTKKSLVKEFDAFAKQYDVQYQVSALKKHGFYLGRYLDEEDQDYLIARDSQGQETEFRLNCQQDGE